MDWKSVINSAIINAAISAVLGGIAGAWAANWFEEDNQIRSIRSERAFHFSVSSDDLFATASKFITAIAKQQQLDPIKNEMRDDIGRQIQEGDQLKLVFTDKIYPYAEKYQDTLIALRKEIDGTNDPLTMKHWTEAVSRAYDSKLELSKALAKEVGIDS